MRKLKKGDIIRSDDEKYIFVVKSHSEAHVLGNFISPSRTGTRSIDYMDILSGKWHLGNINGVDRAIKRLAKK